jgi:hypothetical protein
LPDADEQADARPGEAVLARAVSAYRDALGDRLLAGYALGSLAHGGFSPLVSDVDLGLILRDRLRAQDRLAIATVARSVKAGGSALDQRLSVFWGSPATLAGRRRGGRFPPLDRLDLLENGRLLTGTDARSGLARPGPDELLVAGAEFARGLLDGALEEIRNPSRLVEAGPRRVTKIVLFPVRFLFTAQTGQVATNAAAAARYLASGPVPATAPAAALVTQALAWRQAPMAGDEAAALLGRELIPLYVQFIDDYVVRLDTLGRGRLAGRLRRYRIRLLA